MAGVSRVAKGFPVRARHAYFSGMFLENANGAAADRLELLRLLKDARKGDVLLVESIDRLSRLSVDDWQKLKAAIDSKGLRIVALDLPTSHQGMGMRDSKGDEFTDRMLVAPADARTPRKKVVSESTLNPGNFGSHKKPRQAEPKRGYSTAIAAALLSRIFPRTRNCQQTPYFIGVPGQVRTANLPLRRGMLYPIELLRHKSGATKRGAMDGVHVNGRAGFCHVVRRAF